MKKYIIGGVLVVALGFYVVFANRHTATPVATTPSQTVSNSSSTTTGSATAQYKDGTYTGSVADAFYGNVQVQATIAGGKITDVEFLQYPDEPGHTTDVSNESMPVLKTEAIAAQSAQVNIISGATQTSQAFQQSLAAALAKAQ